MCKGAPPFTGRRASGTRRAWRRCPALGLRGNFLCQKSRPKAIKSKFGRMTRPHGRASNAPLEMPALRSGRELLKKAHEHGGRLGPGVSCEKMKILLFALSKQKKT